MLRTRNHLWHTSIVTIAREKMSAFLLYSPLLNTSGAAHWMVKPFRYEMLCMDFGFLVIFERPKSAIHTWPESSTRILGWSGVNVV